MTAAVPLLIYRSEDARRLVGICAAAIKTFLLVPPPKHSSPLERGRWWQLKRVCSTRIQASVTLAVPFQVSQPPVTSFLWVHHSIHTVGEERDSALSSFLIIFQPFGWNEPKSWNSMQRYAAYMINISISYKYIISSTNWLKLGEVTQNFKHSLVLNCHTRGWQFTSDESCCLKAACRKIPITIRMDLGFGDSIYCRQLFVVPQRGEKPNTFPQNII